MRTDLERDPAAPGGDLAAQAAKLTGRGGVDAHDCREDRPFAERLQDDADAGQAAW